MLRKRLPSVLAIALLLLQIAIPWTSRYFATQDGPSHLYTATIARELLFNDGSPYSAFYQFQTGVLTNWGMSILLNLLTALVGAAHVEQALSSLCVLLGFLSFSYLLRSIEPKGSRWFPLLNFLLNTWFLWIGFYNFYLGMAVCAWVIGMYIRHREVVSWRRAAGLSAALLLLFFTHPHPFALALMTIAVLALWLDVVVPAFSGTQWRAAVRQAAPAWGRTAVAALPGLLVFALFFRSAGNGQTNSGPEIDWAWSSFPLQVFASSRGRVGQEDWLYPAILFYIVVGILAMGKAEWRSARGALVIAALCCFVLYLVIPNRGLGGDQIKIRFSWAFFIFGSLVAASTRRLRSVEWIVSLFLTAFLTAALLRAADLNVRKASRAVEASMSVLSHVPEGATLVRIGYPTSKTREQLGYDLVALEPLYHVEAWAAAQRGFVDLSDYQALSHLFPVMEKPALTRYRSQFWGFEGADANSGQALQYLLRELPGTIQYALVIADDAESKLPELREQWEQVPTGTDESFLRLYRIKKK